MWLDNALKAIGEFFGWLKQTQDPEVIRKNKLSELDIRISVLRKQIKEKISEPVKKDNSEKFAVELGILTQRLIELCKTRNAIKRQ